MIVRAPKAHFIIEQPWTTVNQVRMAVDETGHDHAAGGIDLTDVSDIRCQPLNLRRGPSGFDRAIADKHGAVGNQTNISKSGATTGAIRATECQQLARTPDQQSIIHLGGASRTGARSRVVRANCKAGSYPAST